MTRYLFLIFIALFFSLNISYSQHSSKADLQKSVKTLPEDTSKVHALVNYAVLLEDEDLDSAAHYYQQAGRLSDKLDFYFGKVRYAMNYSVVLNMQSKPDESRILNEWILGLSMAKKDSLHIAKGHNNLANSYNTMGNYDSAFYHYLKACELFEKINNGQYLNIVYLNISTVLENLLQYDKALEYGRKSISLSKKMNDSLQLSSAMINMASAFSSKQQYDSTIAIMDSVILICKKMNNQYTLAGGYITLGNAYNKLNKYPKAIENFTLSLNTAKALNYGSGMAVAYNSLAQVYFDLKSFERADDYAGKALELIRENKTIDLLQLYKLSADIKVHRKDYPSAYDYLNKYVTLNDSLTGIQTRKYVTELEQKYHTAEKNKELLQKQLLLEESHDKIKQKNFWLLVFSIVVILSSTIAILYYRFYNQKQKLHQKELAALQQQQELERLKARLDGQQEERKRIASDLHDDLGSGLTSILFMADGTANTTEKSLENIPKIAEAAGSIMNKMNEIIWSMNTEYDTLDDLVAYIRHHAVELLEQVNIPYRLIIPDEIPVINISGIHRRNIYLVVNEALHNIVKHAGAESVQIRFSFSDQLKIEIADNGKGIDNLLLNRFGNGLQNMQRRMESIGGTWKISNENGTKIQIAIPII